MNILVKQEIKLQTQILVIQIVKGEPKKIKARNALRLPKDHPAHIQAAKIAGPEDAPANEPKKKEEPGKTKVQADKPAQPGQPTKKDQTAQGKADKEKPEAGAGKPGEKADAPPPEQKLSGVELKSSAEKPPVDPKEKQTKQQLDKEVAKLSNEDQAAAKELNDPNSESRKSTAKNIGDWFKKKVKDCGMVQNIGHMRKKKWLPEVLIV